MSERERYQNLIKRILFDVLGDSAGMALIFHIGGTESLADGDDLRRELTEIFGEGSEVLMRMIDSRMRSEVPEFEWVSGRARI